jgi:hypothetical protein
MSDDPRDASFGELVKQLSTDTSTLIRQEMALARARSRRRARRRAWAPACSAPRACSASGAFGALTACFIALLATALDHTWLAALIVASSTAPSPECSRCRARTRSRSDAAGAANRRNREGGRRMGEDPQVIRREIEETRERMTETVDALGYKADVKARTAGEGHRQGGLREGEDRGSQGLGDRQGHGREGLGRRPRPRQRQRQQ